MTVVTGAPTAGLVAAAALPRRLEAATPALRARRQAAWETFTRLPWPTMRDEDWTRTRPRIPDLDTLVVDPGPTAHGEALVDELRRLRDLIDPAAAFLATTRNGLRTCIGTDALAAQGVIVGDLETLAARHPDVVARALDLVVAPEGSQHGGARFLALWNALWHGGVLVHVPTGVHAAVPVVAAHGAAGAHAAVFPATVAVLEAHSSLTLVEVYASPIADDELYSNAVSVQVLGEGARLDHHVVQRWGSGATHVAHHRALLERDAVLRSFHATAGARHQKAWVEAYLHGAGADARITGVVAGGGEQHVDTQSLQAHEARATTSDLLLKVAVRDRARSVYGGLVVVEEGAAGSNGYVQNRNLMLGRGAHASGIPRLEIRTDDVRCSHGVTAGHVDDEQRFYLQARGIPATQAERIIVRGFFQDALDRCPHPGTAALVGSMLDDVAADELVPGVAAPEDNA